MGISHNPSIVRSGLVLCLDAANPKSYPGSGTTWNDLSGNGNSGTLVNDVGYDSANGGSLIFDGTDEHIKTNFEYNQLTDYTMSCWFRAFGSQLCGLIGFRSNNVNVNNNWQQSQIYIANDINASELGNFIIWSEFVYDFTSNTFVGDRQMEVNISVTTGEWFNLAITSDINRSVIYLNGVQVNEKISSPRPQRINSLPFTIGAASNWDLNDPEALLGGYFLNGSISSTLLYNKSLTAQEIQQNFNMLRGRFGI